MVLQAMRLARNMFTDWGSVFLFWASGDLYGFTLSSIRLTTIPFFNSFLITCSLVPGE